MIIATMLCALCHVVVTAAIAATPTRSPQTPKTAPPGGPGRLRPQAGRDIVGDEEFGDPARVEIVQSGGLWFASCGDKEGNIIAYASHPEQDAAVQALRSALYLRCSPAQYAQAHHLVAAARPARAGK